MISVSQATVADDPGRLEPLTAASDRAPLRLTEHRVPQRWLDRLSSAMGRPVDLRTALAGAGRTLRDAGDCTAAEREALPVAPAATRAYCWAEADTRGWLPGAVAVSGDGDQAPGVIVSAWSRESDGAAGRSAARVAFVDAGEPPAGRDGPDRPREVSALLAVPVDGGQDYRALSSPVSGMVRYQDKLLVTAGAGDADALYVYDLDRIQRATSDAAVVGRVPGGWAADGQAYVLPAVASYRPAGARPRRAPTRSPWTAAAPRPPSWRASGCRRTPAGPPGCGATR